MTWQRPLQYYLTLKFDLTQKFYSNTYRGVSRRLGHPFQHGEMICNYYVISPAQFGAILNTKEVVIRSNIKNISKTCVVMCDASGVVVYNIPRAQCVTGSIIPTGSLLFFYSELIILHLITKMEYN